MDVRTMIGWSMKALIFAPLFLLIAPYSALAGEPPKEPMLRIETGMHTALIRRIGVDREGRYLVTGSIDKTVRVWDLQTGKPLKTIRPPIGEGYEGKIYAVAISPDGKTIACGGWTGGDWEGKYSIYLFDRETGSLKKRLPGQPDVIRHLSYSRDGRFLAAALGGKNGIRVYETEGYGLRFTDSDYGNDSYWADFDGKGRLVTASYDGYVRLYNYENNTFKLIKKEKTKGGSRPFSVSFSPDGSQIAVGFDDSTKVDVLSGEDLSYLFSPDTSAINNGDISSVAWSSDGVYLYAGGRFDKDGNSPVVKWSNGGKGSYAFLQGASDTIMQIIPLQKDGLVFGATDPAFGRIDKADRQVFYQSPVIADHRGNLKGFLVSKDAKIVQFVYEVGGKIPARFSLEKRLIELIDPRALSTESLVLSSPVTSAEGINVEDWEDKYNPKLNNKPLELDADETSRSLAIAPDRKSLLLGAEWWLRLLDTKGTEKWRMPVPGVAWSVNIAGNGKKALAAFGDGTIRWYRMSDGKELLALFPHKDRKRWVIWTPSGYYDASAGAEELIGWHINNGMDQAADFFPIARFRQQFYRPDVIAKVLETLDEQEAVKLADTEAGRKAEKLTIETGLPPVVLIAGSGTMEVKSTLVSVPFTVRSPSGEPITAVSTLVSGLPAASLKGIRHAPKEGETLEMSIPVPEQDAEVSIIAENRFARSEPATLRLLWKGEAVQPKAKPKLYILAVGVSTYYDANLKLNFADKDATEFVTIMEKQKGGIYEDVKIFSERPLIDKEATRDNIVDGLRWLELETTDKDTAVIFLSGHGMTERGIYYFLPFMADKGNLKKTGLAYSEIINTVKVLAGKVVVFVDTCKAGGIMGGTKGPFRLDDVVNELVSTPKVVVVYASTTGYQDSEEKEAWKHGAFTKAVLEGLQGNTAHGKTRKVTVLGLADYITERVKVLTKGQQTPTQTNPQGMNADIINFTLAVTR